MEKGTRVQEIRKRFEGLNSPNNDSFASKNPLPSFLKSSGSNSAKNSTDLDLQSVTKGIIRRSHAFRNDKTKIKLSNSNIVLDKNLIGLGVINESSSKSVVKLEEKSFPLKDSKASSSHLQTKPVALKINVDSLTDTLKKALKNPLPVGPAPKKPPRTFAHAGNSPESLIPDNSDKKTVITKLSDSLLLNKNGNSVPSVALPRRSKTDPHIMLKKLESALLTNQINNKSNAIVTPNISNCTQPVFKQSEVSQNTTNSKFNKFCLNGFSSCLNPNIYDAPSLLKIKSEAQNNINLTSNKSTYGTIRKVQNIRHIYEEPYSPRSERKNKGSVTNKNDSPQPKLSVHYMSSPVRESRRMILPESVTSSELNNKKIKMITDTFNENMKSDSDADSIQEERTDFNKGNQEEVTAVRKVYVKRVSSMRQQTIRLPRQGQNLFEVLLLIGLDQDVKLGKVPYVKSKYPESVVLPESLAELVFPDADDWPPSAVSLSGHHNNYTLVLTSEDGARKYAYCRRLQPEGAPICLPLAYVLISQHKDNIFYYKILSELEARHGMPVADYYQFVRSLFYSSIPNPGLSLQFGDVIFRRAVDARQESYDISRVLQALTVPIFIKAFSTLLIERKVILVGSNISLVSDCIEGLLKAIFPFEWEHTLIGAVPSSMLELCTAPTPFLMGVIRPKNKPHPSTFLPLTCIEDCLVADVDNSEVIKSCGDELSILPNRLILCLKSALYLCPVHSTDVGASEALMRLFVELVGHFNGYIITDVHTNNRTFQRESFVKTPNSRSTQLFLEWFTETAMFQSFIQRRLERSFEHGLFEQRCAEYIEENIKNHNVKKERSINKTVKTIGGRFKDWTSSS
ncbi:unnamed protein product [Nezara viridula]|uniref:UDENN domain-containing protein n=1 Tax=Nezara viridula TaxID=85310 RepID=A0A9P0H3Z2_NEZVI|nr:unnamed protein product [Nezara viridula]